jgi:hypothetical protein
VIRGIRYDQGREILLINTFLTCNEIAFAVLEVKVILLATINLYADLIVHVAPKLFDTDFTNPLLVFEVIYTRRTIAEVYGY